MCDADISKTMSRLIALMVYFNNKINNIDGIRYGFNIVGNKVKVVNVGYMGVSFPDEKSAETTLKIIGSDKIMRIITYFNSNKINII